MLGGGGTDSYFHPSVRRRMIKGVFWRICVCISSPAYLYLCICHLCLYSTYLLLEQEGLPVTLVQAAFIWIRVSLQQFLSHKLVLIQTQCSYQDPVQRLCKNLRLIWRSGAKHGQMDWMGMGWLTRRDVIIDVIKDKRCKGG